MREPQFPRIHLAVDTCFAAGRWSDPRIWAEIVAESGVKAVAVSADCDFDPLYTEPGWYAVRLNRLKDALNEYGLKVSAFTSGEGTRFMMGFGSPAAAQRQYLIERWLTPFAETASALGAGVGWYFQAIPDEILEDPEQYREARKLVGESVHRAARAVWSFSCPFAAVGQMYSPGQIPWTIGDTEDFIRQTGIWTILDTGCQTGQHNFVRPPREELRRGLTEDDPIPYVGTRNAAELYRRAKREYAAGRLSELLLDAAEEDMDRHPYLFAAPEDGDLYRWLGRLGCFSPIIHLQQTDGRANTWQPFTRKYNRLGVVRPEKFLVNLKKAYDAPENPGFPPRCRDIWMTVRLRFPASKITYEVKEELSASVRWWRKFIPEDGLTLDALLTHCKSRDRDFSR